MRVLKFGGTSVANAERIRGVADIVLGRAARGPVVTVVSALGGTTETLDRGVCLAAAGEDYRTLIESVRERHLRVAAEVVRPGDSGELAEEIEARVGEARERLASVALLGEASARVRDALLSVGEELSSLIVAAALRQRGADAVAVSARGLIRTDSRFGNARVDFAATEPRIRERLSALAALPVVTGFIGSDANGVVTTLGRGGSDYTAAILGVSLGAARVEIWTDVDGVMSADPRLVPDAFPILELGFDELIELGRLGAKVVYPPTVELARDRGLPLAIKNTFRPDAPGTLVTADRASLGSGVRSLCASGDVALVRLGGAGLNVVRDLAGRALSSLSRAAVPILEAQHCEADAAISLTVRPERAEAALAALEEEFAAERTAGTLDAPVVEAGLTVLNAVGPGVGVETALPKRLFSELSLRDVAVPTLSQAVSDHRLSFAVARRERSRALRAAHRAFFSRPAARTEIFVAGVGAVGGALLDRLGELEAVRSGEVAISGLADSRKVALAARSIDLDDWQGALAEGQPMQLEALAEVLAERPIPRRVFVDCTASPDLGRIYPSLLRQGVSVVTANRRALAADLASWALIEEAARAGGTDLLLGAAVAPGLALMPTVEDLARTGEGVAELKGVLSGSISFILDRVSAGAPFSDAVREAVDLGLAEPDPLDDLSGMDLARKLVVLARAAGLAVEVEDVAIEPLVPLCWPGRPASALWSDLHGLDTGLEVRRRRASARGHRLCYVASFGVGAEPHLTVALEDVPASDPFFDLAAGESHVRFASGGRNPRDWSVRGPAAGPLAVAAALAAEVLRAGGLRLRVPLQELASGPAPEQDAPPPPLRSLSGLR